MPDPSFKGCQRHVFFVAAHDLPDGIPRDVNPRAQNTDRLVWKEIRKHLLNEEGTPNSFHLKNKGITILASDVRKSDESEEEFVLLLKPNVHGIVDGGHTYNLITGCGPELRERREAGENIEQYVKIEVLTGFDASLSAEVAGGLNTAIQVQEMSLANLRGEFDWIKDALHDQPYLSQIAFRENEQDCQVDVRDIIAVLYLFNIHAFPHNASDHPVAAYTSKSSVLEHYLRHSPDYKTMVRLVPDILTLHDTIANSARNLHNEAGGRGGKLAFVEKRAHSFSFPFIGQTSEYRLARAALYPILGAFRWMVVIDPETRLLRWRRDFRGVLELWNSVGSRLMKQTQLTSEENGRKVHAIGRSASHWQTLYSTLALADMMASAQQ